MPEPITCECFDKDCPVCKGHCFSKSAFLLARVDMQNALIELCEECSQDALESGLFVIVHREKENNQCQDS